MSQTIWLW